MNTPKSEWPVYDILGQEIKVNDLVLFAKASRSSGSIDIGLVTGFTPTRVNYRIKKQGRDYRGGYKEDYADVWANKNNLFKRFEVIDVNRGKQRIVRYARAFSIQAFVLDRSQTIESLEELEFMDLPDHMFTEEKRP